MDGMHVAELVREGQDALERADWGRAQERFEAALEQEESAEALDGLGRALHFGGDYARAIELTERAFAAYHAQGRVEEAADRARWLAFLHGTVNANMAVAAGWMARAESLLGGTERGPAHGWLLIDQAPFTDDARAHERLAASALAIARRFGDADLEFDAMALLGQAHVATGRVAEGMALLDQAMTAVTTGEVRGVVAMGDIVCRLLGACELALDVSRAEEWMSVAGGFEAWKDWVSPVCRHHYGGILVAVGRWSEAEVELSAAIRTFERSYRLMRQSPLVKLAELRVRQGRLEEAGVLLEGQESHPIARRALAGIALARGETELAEDLAHLCLEAEAPEDPGCATTLELLVRIRLARDETAAAAEACERIVALASRSRDDRARAFADLASGMVATASGETATAFLQEALRRFKTLNHPYEAGRAQLELARALAGGSPQAAIAEARAALGAFQRIGAQADAAAAAALLRELGARGLGGRRRAGSLTNRENEVLALLADGCTNAEIAERLVISRRTAEHHVASILSKLGLRSRAEAAAYAIRREDKDQ
jgi:DNA-binding NarL/FixJ family response regulator/tetratricopeptide (TPR) repeat protein